MKILVSDPIAKDALAFMSKVEGIEVDVKEMSAGELLECIKDYDAIIVRSATKVTKEVIQAGKKLKVIGRAGVGLDNVDKTAADEAGIKVVNTPKATSISVAELVIGLMFALSRSLTFADSSMKAGRWEKKKLMGTELYGKTLGIIGLGNIGKEIAIRANALGMNVLAHDVVIDGEFAEKHGVKSVTFDNLISSADYITINVPKIAKTTNMITEAEFAKMKKGVFFINCSRGGIVDEDALLKALESGHVKGAGIDVFAKEPIPSDHPFLKLDNVVLSPHIGAATVEGQDRAGTQIAHLVVDALTQKITV